MNMDRDYRFQHGPLGDFNQGQNHPTPRPVTPEEIQEWNNCIKESIIKVGLPFACTMHVLNAFIKLRALNKANTPSAPPPLMPGWLNLRPKFVFIGNFFLGMFLYSPVCYKRLQTKYYATQQKLLKEKEEGGASTKTEGGIFQTDDSFHSSLESNLDGSENSFSHLDLDFDSSISDKLILDDAQDQKSKQSIPETTYDDLRRRNRENFNRNFTSPAPSVRDDPRQSRYSGPVVQKPPTDEPLPQKVIRNKYGDEMES